MVCVCMEGGTTTDFTSSLGTCVVASISCGEPAAAAAGMGALRGFPSGSPRHEIICDPHLVCVPRLRAMRYRLWSSCKTAINSHKFRGVHGLKFFRTMKAHAVTLTHTHV